MAERRAKILSETLSLIEEKGMEGVTLQAISERAGVALKTIYNVLGDRNAVVALAIDYCQEAFLSSLAHPIIANIDDALDHMAACCDAFIHKRAWTKAATALYFSQDIAEPIYRSLVDMANIYFSALLKEFRKTGVLQPWTPAEIVEQQFSNAAHVVSHDWALGRTPDQLYGLKMNLTVVMALIGFVKDPMRQQLTQHLETISRKLAAHAANIHREEESIAISF